MQYDIYMKRIPAIIIQTPDSIRFKPLVESIGNSRLFELTILTATMGVDISNADEATIAQEKRRFGRALTQNERACAISHQRARKIISESETGGVIFEDDARITDLGQLEKATESFLRKCGTSASALGLLDYSAHQEPGSPGIKPFRFHRLFAEIPLAVATVLSPLAASQLVTSSKCWSQTADWPMTTCKYFFLSKGCVRHGDGFTESVIGETSDRIRGKKPIFWSRAGFSVYSQILRQKIDIYLIGHFQS
jgi:GR25 family glycosyltransferase involved in LPS biosynthesis